MTQTLKKLISLLIIFSFSRQSIGVDSTLYATRYPLSKNTLRPVASKLAGQRPAGEASLTGNALASTRLNVLDVQLHQTSSPEEIQRRFNELNKKWGGKAAWLLILQELGLPEKLGFKIPTFALFEEAFLREIDQRYEEFGAPYIFLKINKKVDQRLQAKEDKTFWGWPDMSSIIFNIYIECAHDESLMRNRIFDIVNSDLNAFLEYGTANEWTDFFVNLFYSPDIQRYVNNRITEGPLPFGFVRREAGCAFRNSIENYLFHNSLSDEVKRKWAEKTKALGALRIWRSSRQGEDSFETSWAGFGISRQTDPLQEFRALNESLDKPHDTVTDRLQDVLFSVFLQDYIWADKAGIAFSNIEGYTSIEVVVGEGSTAVSGSHNVIIDISRTTGKIEAVYQGYDEEHYKRNNIRWRGLDLDRSGWRDDEQANDFVNRIWKENTLKLATETGEEHLSPLDKDELYWLKGIVVGIEETLGFPVDVEFSFKGNDIFIVQSRPITGNFSKTYQPLPEFRDEDILAKIPISIGTTGPEGFVGHIVGPISAFDLEWMTLERNDGLKYPARDVDSLLLRYGLDPDKIIVAEREGETLAAEAIDFWQKPVLITSGYSSRIYHGGIRFREGKTVVLGMPGLLDSIMYEYEHNNPYSQIKWRRIFSIEDQNKHKEGFPAIDNPLWISTDPVKVYSNDFRAIIVKANAKPSTPRTSSAGEGKARLKPAETWLQDLKIIKNRLTQLHEAYTQEWNPVSDIVQNVEGDFAMGGAAVEHIFTGQMVRLSALVFGEILDDAEEGLAVRPQSFEDAENYLDMISYWAERFSRPHEKEHGINLFGWAERMAGQELRISSTNMLVYAARFVQNGLLSTEIQDKIAHFKTKIKSIDQEFRKCLRDLEKHLMVRPEMFANRDVSPPAEQTGPQFYPVVYNSSVSSSTSTPRTSSAGETPITTAGWTQTLAKIVASKDYPAEKVNLKDLLDYVKQHYPGIVEGASTADEEMILLCLALVNDSGRHFFQIAKKLLNETYSDDYTVEFTRFGGRPIPDEVPKNTEQGRSYANKKELIEGLDDKAFGMLSNLKKSLLPQTGLRAFALPQYFSEGYHQQFDSDIYPEDDAQHGRAFFDLCIHPENRKFIGQWERDYAQYLSKLSAYELEEEWERLMEISGQANSWLYVFTVYSFMGDTIQFFHPSYTFDGIDFDLKNGFMNQDEAMHHIVSNIAKMSIYLEWVQRHWAVNMPAKRFSDLPKIIEPSLEYIEKSIGNRRQAQGEKTPFKQRPIYEVVTSVSDLKALEILQLKGKFTASAKSAPENPGDTISISPTDPSTPRTSSAGEGKSLSIVFFSEGTELGKEALHALIKSKHNIACVVTMPDSDDIIEIAAKHNLNIIKVWKHTPRLISRIRKLEPDLGISVVWSKIPQDISNIPDKKFINLHPSQLPKLRGGSPLVAAKLYGLNATGVTVHKLTENFDEGDILKQAVGIKISETDTALSLSGKIAPVAAELLVTAVDEIADGTTKPLPQTGSSEPSAWWYNLEPYQNVNWNQNSRNVIRQIHAFNFWPDFTAKTTAGKDELLVLLAVPGNTKHKGHNAGEIIEVLGDMKVEGISFGKIYRIATKTGNIAAWIIGYNEVLEKLTEGVTLGHPPTPRTSSAGEGSIKTGSHITDKGSRSGVIQKEPDLDLHNVDAFKKSWLPLLGYAAADIMREQELESDWLPVTIKESATRHEKLFDLMVFIATHFSLEAFFVPMDLTAETEAIAIANGVKIEIDIGENKAPEIASGETFFRDDRAAFTAESISRLKYPNPNDHGRVKVYLKALEAMDALQDLTGRSWFKIAYITGPYTLAGQLLGSERSMMAYLIEEDRQAFDELMAYCEEVTRRNAEAFIKAGADAIMILDPHASNLTFLPIDESSDTTGFSKYCIKPINRLSDFINSLDIPVLMHTCVTREHMLGPLSELDVQGYSLDPNVDIEQAYEALIPGANKILIGNFDTTLLYSGSEEKIYKEVDIIMNKMSGKERFVLATACDVPVSTPEKHIWAFRQACIDWYEKDKDSVPAPRTSSAGEGRETPHAFDSHRLENIWRTLFPNSTELEINIVSDVNFLARANVWGSNSGQELYINERLNKFADDEIAFVLAHEGAHLMGLDYPVPGFLTGLFFYYREKELKAHEEGFKIAVVAEFDPGAALSILDKSIKPGSLWGRTQDMFRDIIGDRPSYKRIRKLYEKLIAELKSDEGIKSGLSDNMVVLDNIVKPIPTPRTSSAGEGKDTKSITQKLEEAKYTKDLWMDTWMATPLIYNETDYPDVTNTGSQMLLEDALNAVGKEGINLPNLTKGQELTILGFSTPEFNKIFLDCPNAAKYHLFNNAGAVIAREAVRLWAFDTFRRLDKKIRIYHLDATDMLKKIRLGSQSAVFANGILSVNYNTKEKNVAIIKAVREALAPGGLGFLRASPQTRPSDYSMEDLREIMISEAKRHGGSIIFEGGDWFPTVVFQVPDIEVFPGQTKLKSDLIIETISAPTPKTSSAGEAQTLNDQGLHDISVLESVTITKADFIKEGEPSADEKRRLNAIDRILDEVMPNSDTESLLFKLAGANDAYALPFLFNNRNKLSYFIIEEFRKNLDRFVYHQQPEADFSFTIEKIQGKTGRLGIRLIFSDNGYGVSIPAVLEERNVEVIRESIFSTAVRFKKVFLTSLREFAQKTKGMIFQAHSRGQGVRYYYDRGHPIRELFDAPKGQTIFSVTIFEFIPDSLTCSLEKDMTSQPSQSLPSLVQPARAISRQPINVLHKTILAIKQAA